jgi:predicted nucleic acid-binding protein
MNVVVDTSVWSLALRRSSNTGHPAVARLTAALDEGRVVMLGAIRQELLSGISKPAQARVLRDRLRAFPDLLLETADYEDAANCFNECRRRGIQGSNTDFLICAASRRRRYSILSTDRDFQRFAPVLGLVLDGAS